MSAGDGAARPTLHTGTNEEAGVLVWTWPDTRWALSSAPVGGGLRTTRWILNVGVPANYSREDLSDHSNEVAHTLELEGRGITLFTAADLTRRQRSSIGSATVDATVGISHPTWAADPDSGWDPWRPGTINLVIQVDRPLDDGAAVNAVITATEAKTQALLDQGIAGTGTASDAVVVVWPAPSAAPVERFAGPRSRVGREIAEAVYVAITAGLAGSHQQPGNA